MELGPMLEAYGLPGLMIAGLAWAVRTLWERYQAVQDARIAEMRDAAEKHSTLVREIKATLDATLAAIQGGGR